MTKQKKTNGMPSCAGMTIGKRNSTQNRHFRAGGHSILLFLLICACVLFAIPSFAADKCYSVNELKAEQLLRLHSELMVITVTCRQGSQGENLVPAYTGFTQENLKQLHAAEKIMMHYYAAIYGGDGVAQLDKLRTKLGNEFGQRIADISAPLYCSQYRDKVLQFNSCTPGQLDDEVNRLVAAGKSYGHVCAATNAP